MTGDTDHAGHNSRLEPLVYGTDVGPASNSLTFLRRNGKEVAHMTTDTLGGASPENITYAPMVNDLILFGDNFWIVNGVYHDTPNVNESFVGITLGNQLSSRPKHSAHMIPFLFLEALVNSGVARCYRYHQVEKSIATSA